MKGILVTRGHANGNRTKALRVRDGVVLCKLCPIRIRAGIHVVDPVVRREDGWTDGGDRVDEGRIVLRQSNGTVAPIVMIFCGATPRPRRCIIGISS
jgi:hypothetical protein